MACIEPAYWTTIMPLKVQQNFNKTMLAAEDIAFWRTTWEYFMYNSTNNNNTDFVGLPSEDFTIELDGLTVTVPREEWIYPAVQPNFDTGAWTVVPGRLFLVLLLSAILTVRAGSIQTTVGTAGWPDGVDPKLPFLGGPFLSQVYLVVDYETGVFSLAPIDRGAASTSLGMVTLGCDDQNLPPGKDDGTKEPLKKKKSSLAPIIGGVVGGIVLIALLAAIVIFRRRRRTPVAPTDIAVLPPPTKEQSEAHHGFHHQPYDAPPAFSPSPSPGPYSPPNSPGPYMGMAGVPMRRPLPGQDYAQPGSPPPGGYYDGQQGYHMSGQPTEPVELKGTDVLSELSGSQPRPYSDMYEGGGGGGGSVVSGQTNNR